MVTIVLLVIWVCGTVPKHKQDRLFKIQVKYFNISLFETRWWTLTHKASTYCGGGGYSSVCGNNRCHSGCSHWCDRAEDWLLWGTDMKNIALHHGME